MCASIFFARSAKLTENYVSLHQLISENGTLNGYSEVWGIEVRIQLNYSRSLCRPKESSNIIESCLDSEVLRSRIELRSETL